MIKIIFGITSLELGGAERVLVDLANELIKTNKYEITILQIYGKGYLRKELDDRIRVRTLYNKKFSEYSKFEKIKISSELLYSKEIEKNYDVYISFLEGPITRLFSKVKNGRKIAWIHNDISKIYSSENSLKQKVKLRIDKKCYDKYQKIVFVSKENQDDFNKTFDYPKEKEVIIRNYLNYEKVIEKSNEKVDLPFDKNDINLLCVCRLTKQKGIDRFIKVHKKLEQSGVHSKVFIVGGGPEKENLLGKIEEYNEQDDFYFLGEKENPYPYIKNCDFFVLLSYYEGYGMVIDEAKILNKIIIITNTAAKEALQNYKKSYILENTEKRNL